MKNKPQISARIIKDDYGSFAAGGRPRLISSFTVLRTEHLYAAPYGDQTTGFFPAGSRTYDQGALTLDTTIIQEIESRKSYWVLTSDVPSLLTQLQACCLNPALLAPLTVGISNKTSNAFDINIGGLLSGSSYDVSLNNGASWIGTSGNATYHVTGVVAGTTYNVLVRHNKVGFTSALSQVNTFVL